MITIEDVEHIAKLAKLSLSEEEKIKYANQMNHILGYFNQLEELDKKNNEHMTNPVSAERARGNPLLRVRQINFMVKNNYLKLECTVITTKDVEHVAKLARMALSEEEKTMFTEQLGNILEYI